MISLHFIRAWRVIRVRDIKVGKDYSVDLKELFLHCVHGIVLVLCRETMECLPKVHHVESDVAEVPLVPLELSACFLLVFLRPLFSGVRVTGFDLRIARVVRIVRFVRVMFWFVLRMFRFLRMRCSLGT